MKNWFGYIGTKLLLIVLIFSVFENLLLIIQVRQLKNLLSKSTAQSYSSLSVGDELPMLQLKDLNGSARELNLSGDKLLFVFSASCPACESNFRNWREIEKEVGSEAVHFLSVDTKLEAKSFAMAEDLTNRILVLPSAQEKSAFKVFRIPQTIYVSNNKVKAIQVGVLSPEKIHQFKNFQKEN